MRIRSGGSAFVFFRINADGYTVQERNFLAQPAENNCRRDGEDDGQNIECDSLWRCHDNASMLKRQHHISDEERMREIGEIGMVAKKGEQGI